MVRQTPTPTMYSGHAASSHSPIRLCAGRSEVIITTVTSHVMVTVTVTGWEHELALKARSEDPDSAAGLGSGASRLPFKGGRVPSESGYIHR